MDTQREDSLAADRAPSLTRRSALRRGVGVTALVGGVSASRPAMAQESTPVPVTSPGELPGTIGTLFNVVVSDLPPGPVQLTLSRLVTEPGVGDLEDYFTFPGPVAFVLESGEEICHCGTTEAPCMLLRADGTSEPAPPSPADIHLGPGEGLYIPTNSPDSFTVPGPDPAVELNLSIFPAEMPGGTPVASPTI